VQVTPNGQQQLLDRVLAYDVNTSRAGEAFTFGAMHCMSFVMLKAHPGQRWRRLFDGDTEGLRELPLGEPPHSVAEQQVDGFKPVNHYRVAGRKDTESEWCALVPSRPIPSPLLSSRPVSSHPISSDLLVPIPSHPIPSHPIPSHPIPSHPIPSHPIPSYRYEVTINVPVPEACERKHLSVVLEGDRLAVRCAGWMEWERRIQSRNLRWEDKHESRTRVDMHNSTWLMTRDEERDFKCVQFVLSEWQEGANKNAESEIRRQLQADKGKIVLVRPPIHPAPTRPHTLTPSHPHTLAPSPSSSPPSSRLT
jgi:hypothetical protein